MSDFFVELLILINGTRRCGIELHYIHGLTACQRDPRVLGRHNLVSELR